MTSINYSEYSPIGKVLDIAWHMILPTIALTVTSFAGVDVRRDADVPVALDGGLAWHRTAFKEARGAAARVTTS